MFDDPITKVSIQSSKKDIAIQVLGGLGTLASVAQSVPAIYALLSGAKSDTDRMISAINEMATRIEKGLKEVEKAVKAGHEIGLWDAHRLKMLEWKRKIIRRAHELGSFDSTTGMVEVKSKDIDIATWCSDEGREEGVLTDLAGIFDGILEWLEASDDIALGPIEQWDHMARTGAAFDALGIKDESPLSLMFLFYKAVSAMLQTATYVRNGALLLYRTTPGALANLRNLDKKLDLFGRMTSFDPGQKPTAATGAWSLFEAKFDSYPNSYLSGSLFNDSKRISCRESLDHSSDHIATFSDDHAFTLGGFRANPGAQSYIAGLRFAHHDGAWGVHATIVTIEDDGSLKVRHDVPPRLVEAIDRNGYRLFMPCNLKKFTPTNRMAFGEGVIEQPRPTSLSQPAYGLLSHNVASVVVGFSVEYRGSAHVIVLQYGEMVMRPDGRLWIMPNPINYYTEIFRGPTNPRSQWAITKDVDKLHRGLSGTGSLAPITNASFTRDGEAMGIRTSHCTLFRADPYQPALLKQFSPKNLAYPAKTAPTPTPPAPSPTPPARGST